MRIFAPKSETRMKKILFCMIAALAASPAAAQFTIDQVKTEREKIALSDSIRRAEPQAEYFSRARYRAERAAIRKERNKLEITGGLQGAMTSYNDPWVDVSGGDNSIALIANLFVHHIFTKNLFTLETKFEAKFGYNRMKVEIPRYGANGEPLLDEAGNKLMEREGIWYKNQDEFYIQISPSFKMSKNWSYGATLKFRSQLANGYLSRTEQEHKDLKSCFMTPGYLDLSVGVKWSCPLERFPIKIELSPIALSAVYATNSWIRREQFDEEGNRIKKPFAYGIEDPDKNSKYEGGSSIQIDFDRTFGRTKCLRYRTTLFSFYGWITNIGLDNKIRNYHDWLDAYEKWADPDDPSVGHTIKDKPALPIHPTVRWENTLDIKATKFLTTTLSFQLYYNRAQHTAIQTKTLLSVGLSYTFKNK